MDNWISGTGLSLLGWACWQAEQHRQHPRKIQSSGKGIWNWSGISNLGTNRGKLGPTGESNSRQVIYLGGNRDRGWSVEKREVKVFRNVALRGEMWSEVSRGNRQPWAWHHSWDEADKSTQKFQLDLRKVRVGWDLTGGAVLLQASTPHMSDKFGHPLAGRALPVSACSARSWWQNLAPLQQLLQRWGQGAKPTQPNL